VASPLPGQHWGFVRRAAGPRHGGIRHLIGATAVATVLGGIALCGIALCGIGLGGTPLAWAAPAAATTVRVGPGDTLTAIAHRYGTTVAALASANGITNPNHIVIGSKLTVPAPGAGATMAPASYVVQQKPSGLPPLLVAHPDRLQLQPIFQRWAAAFGVPANLLEALCWWESGWQTNVVSATGAIGIGQLEPSTVRRMQVRLGNPALDPRSASDNIEMSAALLHDLLVQTGGNQQMALAGYYQGLASVTRQGMFPATRHYVAGIMAYVPHFS
jgi:LysM repeat protein